MYGVATVPPCAATPIAMYHVAHGAVQVKPPDVHTNGANTSQVLPRTGLGMLEFVKALIGRRSIIYVHQASQQNKIALSGRM